MKAVKVENNIGAILVSDVHIKEGHDAVQVVIRRHEPAPIVIIDNQPPITCSEFAFTFSTDGAKSLIQALAYQISQYESTTKGTAQKES